MIDDLTAISTDDLLDGDERVAEEATEQLISFRLGDEWYGVSVAAVREVVRVGRITFLPSAPAHIVGIVNLRGNIVSVTDPKRLLQLPPSGQDEKSRVVVIEVGSIETALLVDEVGEVVDVPLSQFEPPLVTLDGSHAAFIEHTCRSKGRLMAVLKVAKLVDSWESMKTSALQNDDPHRNQRENG